MESTNRKDILICIDWFVPGYKAGGPIKSVLNISKALEPHANIFICTSDRDLNAAEAYSGVERDKWLSFSENTQVIYLSAEGKKKAQLTSVLSHKDFDVLYFNSVFSVKFSLLPLYLSKKLHPRPKVILAPRGMLGKGALQLKSTKKNIFLTAAKILGLYKGITWHTSSELESSEVKAVFGEQANTAVAPNLANLSNSEITPVQKNPNELSLFFISRISEKKNLLGALELLNREYPGTISLSIYGPIEDEEYWHQCEKAIEQLSDNISVTYQGVLKPDQIGVALSTHHFMLFPTFHENFGHVIVESLVNGKPVLISDQTPWKDLESKRVGWEIPLLDKAQFELKIKECLHMTNDDYEEMSHSAFEYGKQVVNDRDVLEKNLNLFLQ